MNREIRPAFMIGPFDVIDGPLPAGPGSPVTVLVPDLVDAIANLFVAGLNPQIIATTATDDDSTERAPW